jgi:hypothetical protein
MPTAPPPRPPQRAPGTGGRAPPWVWMIWIALLALFVVAMTLPANAEQDEERTFGEHPQAVRADGVEQVELDQESGRVTVTDEVTELPGGLAGTG